jgi:hypothetical protein
MTRSKLLQIADTIEAAGIVIPAVLSAAALVKYIFNL